MRYTLLFSVFVFFSAKTQAQDTLIRVTGEKIIAKILEVGIQEIKYKRFNFDDGPTYVENRNTIKTIIYKNGQRDEFSGTVPSLKTLPPPSNDPTEDYVSRNHAAFQTHQI